MIDQRVKTFKNPSQGWGKSFFTLFVSLAILSGIATALAIMAALR